MKKMLLTLGALAALATSPVHAQSWNKEAYPDYNPNFSNPDPTLIKYGKLSKGPRKAKSKQQEMGLPDHVNNAQTPYFPPAFNQAGGSCGSASRIGYMFTHEINSYRGEDASTLNHQYPTHFVWLLTSGRSGKDEFIKNVGVPSAETYGGRTYSSLFGYQEETNNDFGWMQGYDKWFSGFWNRCTSPTSVPYHLGTEEGRLAAKAWLYNHAGDETFKAGGLIGLGVASGGDWQPIIKTATNDALGVTGMKYVRKWGASVDHALTMVGYDDRIEFDLDGNGIAGEEDKDEKGAWIIVNSWGDGWCNGGFIYCPYANAGPTSDQTTNKLNGGFWYGELYHTRKDYRPLRTIKLTMQYSRRSEMQLCVGASADLSATMPERTIIMDHFNYAGDGKNGDANPAPEVPMLGKWADGKLHTEPMEFGYDVTDLSSGFDKNMPLKYFFIVNTKSWAAGAGKILGASIIDYEHDRLGVETPFDLGSAGNVEIRNAGGQTIISVVVQGGGYYPVRNLAVNNNTLTWEKPITSGHSVQSYKIYKDDVLLTTTQDPTLSITESGTYAVTCLYEDQTESKAIATSTRIEKQEPNQVLKFAHGGFSIPGIFDNHMQECTIEFYFNPNSMVDWNNAFGPGWGTFYAHCNENRKFTVGWDNNNRINSSTTLTKGSWKHISIVINKNQMTLYIGRNMVGSITSDTHSGIGGFGNMVFSAASGKDQDASYDEIRIWNKARTKAEIESCQANEFYGDILPDGLIAYYKGDLIQSNGNTYMKDCVGGHHALISNANYAQEVPTRQPALFRPWNDNLQLTINDPGTIRAGEAVQLTATRDDAINSLVWNIQGTSLQNAHVASPTVIFPTPGEYEIKVEGSDYEAEGETGVANTVNNTRKVIVSAAEDFTADFTATATSVAAGDRIHFHAQSPIVGYSYQWSLKGADVERVLTPSAGATYQAPGDYEVILTVTAPDGRQKTKTQQVSVRQVAPIANFTVSQPCILKGESVVLNNTSKYAPKQIQWTLEGTVNKTTVNGGEAYTFTPTEPGVYNISLQATNEMGSDTKLVNRALLVANANSLNGLSFRSGSRVTCQKPIREGSTFNRLTIDWWMLPNKLSDYCQGIGESQNTLLLRTNANGSMSVLNGKTRSVTSDANYVIAGEWHHYAVVYNAGKVTFFRDGQTYGTTKTGLASSCTVPSTFSIGTEAADFNGSIDEFRVWGYSMGKSFIQSICNQPMDDPENYITGDYKDYELLLYYNFNQSGGDVKDLTSRSNHATRSNFGPDGDAWDLSRGVFCLNFGSMQDDVIVDGIESITQAGSAQMQPAQGIYTLTGVRVTEQQARNCPGIYIVNGKKVVVQ